MTHNYEDYLNRFESAHSYLLIWTCNSPHESHIMEREEVELIDRAVSDYTVWDDSDCWECRGYHTTYNGSLDMVVPMDEHGRQCTEAMDGEEFAETYGMMN